MSAPHHAWEHVADAVSEPIVGVVHAWELPELEAPVVALCEAAGDEDEEESALPERTPSESYIDEMVHLLLCRVLSAQQFCTLMHHAGRAGVEGASALGFRLDAPTGHYQRHLNASLSFFKS